jgi:hypothetical protein
VPAGRHPADRRRGDLRVRPAGGLVRHRAVRGAPEHGRVREGRHQRLPTARRRRRRGARRSPVLG